MKALLLIAIALLLVWIIKKSSFGNERKLLGEPAPAFNLKNSIKQSVTLKNFKGKWLVIYFYPKDDTPGCTKESCSFRDNFQSIQSLNASIVGISLDSTESHNLFQKKYGLPFILLSDPNGEVAKKYGALNNFIIFKFANRQSFIIDPEGIVRQVYRTVNPHSHSEEVIADLKKLISNT